MNINKREFIIKELMTPDFISQASNCIILEELEETGRSELQVHLISKESLCIKNVDKKHTEIYFFNKEKGKSLFKRVDHIIYEHLSQNNWKLHLIEMKSSVGFEKWIEIKGKFRASYLLAQGIASMLEMNIAKTCLYTTYERVDLKQPSSTMPTGRRPLVGVPQIKPVEEWSGGKCGLNFGVRMAFQHTPVQMIRNEDKILTGTLTI